MFSFLRPASPARKVRAQENPVYYEDGTMICEFHSPEAEYSMTHTIPTNTSPFQPPLHVHPVQHEDFIIHKGEAMFYMPRHPNPALRKVPVSGSTVDPEARKVHVPMGQYHRFENSLPDVPLVLSVKFDEPNWEVEECFFRNFFGYLDDCRLAGTQPSVFQLMRFLWDLNSPVGLPIPGPNWLGVTASRAFCGLMGVVIGQGLLGYKGSYPEYYNPKGSK